MEKITIEEQKEFWKGQIKFLENKIGEEQKKLDLVKSPGFLDNVIAEREKIIHDLTLRTKMYYKELEEVAEEKDTERHFVKGEKEFLEGKRTSEEWNKYYDWEILDYDGWDRKNFQYSFYEEKINNDEFIKRLNASTIRRK